MQNYKGLKVWQKAHELTLKVYAETKMFPKEEIYSLTSQLRRCSSSIPANIAEGIGRNYKKDTIQFLHISRGSLYELETFLKLATMLSFINNDKFNFPEQKCQECLKLINGLIAYFEKTGLK